MGLDLVEYVMAIEAEFELLLTLGDVHAYVQAHFGRNTNDPVASWALILALAEDQFGVSASELSPQTRLLELAPDG